MKYNIFEKTVHVMPVPTKYTDFIKICLSKASKDMQNVLLPMFFSALGAHLNNVKFCYSDGEMYEMCGQMGHLIGSSGIGKGQLSHLVEALMRSFRQHDAIEFGKLSDWQRQMKTRAANKEKPGRPDVAFWFPPANMMNAAFLQNAMVCEDQGGRSGWTASYSHMRPKVLLPAHTHHPSHLLSSSPLREPRSFQPNLHTYGVLRHLFCPWHTRYEERRSLSSYLATQFHPYRGDA